MAIKTLTTCSGRRLLAASDHDSMNQPKKIVTACSSSSGGLVEMENETLAMKKW